MRATYHRKMCTKTAFIISDKSRRRISIGCITFNAHEMVINSFEPSSLLIVPIVSVHTKALAVSTESRLIISIFSKRSIGITFSFEHPTICPCSFIFRPLNRNQSFIFPTVSNSLSWAVTHNCDCSPFNASAASIGSWIVLDKFTLL